MNVYITKLNGMFYRSREQYAQHMAADVAHSLGIREMGIYRYDAEHESPENRQKRFDGIIAGVSAGDIVICQFPTWNGVEFERALVRHIKAYHGRIVIFIHDLEAMMFENRRSTLQAAVELYNEAEVLIVPSYAMKRFLMNQGIRFDMKFIVQEIWDYTTRLQSLGPGKLKREIHFAGDADRFVFPHAWNYEVPLIVYTDQECRGENAHRKGWMPPDRLLLELSKGGFGLVWYGDEYWRQYLSMNNSLKLSAYLAAGMPVIVPRGISNQCLIEGNHLGVIVDTLDEAAEIVKNMTNQEYQEYAAAVARFAPLLRDGYFTKKCLVDVLQMSMRRDMYVYSESNETCVMSGGAFEYVCLNESYGDNLALSWTFPGEAEGFLVYDADSGKLVREIFDGLAHYLLLKNYPKESRFIVKAYVRAVRGKMIIAESEIAAIAEKCPTRSLVSLIMPAYNAEEYIARSIDTALAQSFADLELLIVNDGSTDRTQAVIDWYAKRYPQVKSYCQPNGGQASARNVGAEYANGDYIALMDNDDMIRPNMIERLYNAITKNNCDIAMTSIYQIVNGKYEAISEYSLPENTAITVNEFFDLYIEYAYPVIWNKLYRSSLVKEHPFALVTYEDTAWTPYALSYAESICYVNAHLYEYDRTIRSSTAIHVSKARSDERQYTDRRDYIMFFLNNGNPQKKDLLKRLALGYVWGFLGIYSDPKYKELKEEIEQM